MSFSTVLSAALNGLEVKFVHVEADISNGLPMFHMVGYLSAEVKEAGERVRTALRNTGLNLPAKKIVINFSPVNVRKRGAAFDLPMAVALLAAFQMIRTDRIEQTLFAGELSLDGSLRKISGVLPIVDAAKKSGCRCCVIPKGNAAEGALIEKVRIIGAVNLQEVCDYLNGVREGESFKNERKREEGAPQYGTIQHVDYSEVKGQQLMKRATEVAVAGNHNILYIGPPGSGKTMIARRIPTILPPLTTEESIEITKIYSVLGMVDKQYPLIRERPFRSVHHTVTKTALIGGGIVPTPGELSLANGGVIFLDELAEFQKPVLEVLRQPLEEKMIQIVRHRGNYEFPADAILAAAMNPCPCGNYPDYNKCTCTTGQIRQYLGKISQPFLDRIDLCVEATKMDYQTLNDEGKVETSAEIRDRICNAREIQWKRYQGVNVKTNGQIGKKEVDKFCGMAKESRQIMERAFDKMSLTARSYYKIIKVARTIADLAASEDIQAGHLREAIGYRMIDKKYWGRGYEI